MVNVVSTTPSNEVMFIDFRKMIPAKIIFTQIVRRGLVSQWYTDVHDCILSSIEHVLQENAFQMQTNPKNDFHIRIKTNIFIDDNKKHHLSVNINLRDCEIFSGSFVSQATDVGDVLHDLSEAFVCLLNEKRIDIVRSLQQDPLIFAIN